jgi:hypothetical protein
MATSTKEKVGIGAITIAALALVTALVNFGNDHWSGSFGGNPKSSSVAVDAGSRPSSLPETEPAQPDTEIYLSRDAVSEDSQLDVSGEGFAPGEKVIIKIGTYEVARPTANAQGGFKNVSIRIPDFYDPFQKPMVVNVRAASKIRFEFNASRDLTLT